MEGVLSSIVERTKNGKYHCAALAVALIFCFAAVLPWSRAYAGPASLKMKVSARVPQRTDLKVLHRMQRISVTGDDIRRGYVDIRNASRIEVKSNDPAGYMLAFQGIVSWPFREAVIQGLANEVRVDSVVALIHQPYTRGVVTIVLSYRLLFFKDARPGTYAWPVSITSQPV